MSINLEVIKNSADAMAAVVALSGELEKKSNADTGKIETLEKALHAFDIKSANEAKRLEASESAYKDIETKFAALEKEFSKPNAGNKTETKAQLREIERKGMYGFMTGAFDGKSVPTEFKNIMRTDIESAGGIFVPELMEKAIIKKITETSDIYSIAKVTPISTKRVKKATRKSLPTIIRLGETEPSIQSRSSYGSEFIDAYKYTALVQVTQEELDDAEINIEAEILNDIAEAYTQAEGYDFVKGTGVNRAEGFMFSAGVSERVSGATAALTADALVLITGDLKTGYNPRYVFNRKTLAQIRVLKTTTGEYLWQAGNLQGGIPNVLNGEAYSVLPDMDDIAANSYPVAYGDFQRAYEIVLRKGISSIRDIYSLKSSGLVEFMFNKRLGGKLVNKEALVKMKIST